MTTQLEDLEIRDLIARYFRTLQDRDFSAGWGIRYFTDDVRVESPHGTATGQEAVKQSQQAVEQWAVIHYLNTDLIVDRPDPERVTATWSALMTHVPHVEDPEPGQNPSEAPIFTVGGVWEADLRRVSGQWRFSRTSVRPLWTSGKAPQFPGQ